MPGVGNPGDNMGDCELCGATNVSTREHKVNKAILAVCFKCIDQMKLEPKQVAPGLSKARRHNQPMGKKRSFRKNNIMNKSEKELAADFSRRITNARTSKGWSQADLGQRMAETINVIKSAESGKPPTDAVVKKFETVLGVILMVEASNEQQTMVGQSSSSRGMTIGDYLKDLR